MKLMEGEFLANAQPLPPEGWRCYWAFIRECRNAATLEMVTTSLRQARTDGRSILINPEPVTRRDAAENLRAFASDHSGDHALPHHQPATLSTHINPCLGWTTMRCKSANKTIWARRGLPCFEREETYFVIVYHHVPEQELEAPAIQMQLDFFHQVGFVCVCVEKRNWRGPGTLVDFSDLISPHQSE